MVRFSKILAGCAVGGLVIGLSAWNIIRTRTYDQGPSLPPGSYYARLVNAPIAYAECKSFDDGTIIVEYVSDDKISKTTGKNGGRLVSFTYDGVEKRYVAPEREEECSIEECPAIWASERHSIAVSNCSKPGSEIR